MSALLLESDGYVLIISIEEEPLARVAIQIDVSTYRS